MEKYKVERMVDCMAIKYHQNGTANEYGADHQLTNNWNTEKDYGTGQTIKHILGVVQCLIDEGYLVSVVKNDILLIRTINKTEQKKRKLFVA